MTYKLVVDAQDVLFLEGIINFKNAKEICGEGEKLLDNLSSIRVNLSRIEFADSSGLAILISWVRNAKSQHKEIVFLDMPQFLLDMSRVNGLDAILPVVKT